MNSGQNSDGERSGFEYLMSWKEAAAAGPGLAGGKGCNLGRLHTFGFNVPGGIVVCSAAYQAFIEANGLKPLMDCVSAGISSDNIQERAGELRKLSGAIMTGKLPGTLNREIESALVRARLDEKALAVRSSASLEDGARLSLFKESFRGFMHDFGHRALYELDMINPRWHEDPSYLFDIIRSAMNGPGLEQLRDGQPVFVDGDIGRVYLDYPE